MTNPKTGRTEEHTVVAFAMSGSPEGQAALAKAGKGDILHHYSGDCDTPMGVLADGTCLFPSDFSWFDGRILEHGAGEENNPVMNRFFGGAWLKYNVAKGLKR